MLNRFVLFCAALLLAAAAMAQAPDAEEEIVYTPEVERAFDAYVEWRDELMAGETPRGDGWEAVRKRWQRSLEEPEGFSRELLQRTALDQFPRFARVWTPEGVEAVLNATAVELDEADTELFGERLLEDMIAIDTDNTVWVKQAYEARGRWFTISEFGEDVSDAAWLIIQHAAEDKPLMAKVLADMEKLYPLGEVNGPSYALLYDRVEMFAGRPQRYGSQFTCIDGELGPHELEAPERLDELRADVGLGTFEEYAKFFAGQPC